MKNFKVGDRVQPIKKEEWIELWNKRNPSIKSLGPIHFETISEEKELIVTSQDNDDKDWVSLNNDEYYTYVGYLNHCCRNY